MLPENIQKAPQRLSAFVIDRHSGKPVAGVPVTAFAETKDGYRLPIGVLASDHVGYLSFDLSAAPAVDSLAHLWIYPASDEEARIDALPVVDLTPGSAVVHIPTHIPPSIDPRRPVPELPSIQNPCIADCRISPASFGINPSARVGEGGCEVLLPRNLSTHEFRFTQLERALGSAEPLPNPNPADEFFVAPNIYRGRALHYRIIWCPIGHSLGRLIYSLPLAPCESVNLAVIDWSRSDTAARQESQVLFERLNHAQTRDRTIEETVEAAIRESQRGGSFLGGLAGSGIIKGVVSLSGAIGGGFSRSRGIRKVTADATQRLSDSIVQAGTALRNLRSTVVVQATQAEREVLQTRAVTNHNHCHSLTVLYYEVLRHYCVQTEWVGTQGVILIPYPGDEPFDWWRAFCNRHILEPVLLAPHLRPCFDSVEQMIYCVPDELRETGPAPSGTSRTIKSFIVTTSTGERGVTGRVEFHVRLSDGADVAWPLGRGPLPFAPEGIYRFASHRTETFPQEPVRRSDGSPIRVEELEQIGIRLASGEDWDLEGLRVEYYVEEEPGIRVLHANPAINQRFRTRHEWWVSVSAGDEGATALARLRAQVAKDKCCADRLVGHLNCHRAYYNRAIWLGEDPEQRAMRLDRMPYRDGTLLDFIENRPAGVLGNFVAFPELGMEPPEGGRVVAERLVTLPTPGLFAEAQLSHCNACEERDITRFWDWSESPCPREAPEITGITPGSRARTPEGIEPSAFPSPVVNIVNPPSAPDPTAMAGVLELLSTPEIFRDMSGRQEVAGLLQQLAQGSIGLLDARRQAQSLRGRYGLDGGGRGRPSPSEQHDQLQVYRNAEQGGELSQHEAQHLAQEYLTRSLPGSEAELMNVSLTEAQMVLVGFDAEALHQAAQGITQDQIVNAIRGAEGLYRRLDIPDSTEGPGSTRSWRSWEEAGTAGGVGGGWFIPAERGGARWIDFWRPANAASGTPLMFQFIEGLTDSARGQVRSESITDQLGRLVFQRGVLDIGLTLAVAYRESGNTILGGTNLINTFSQGGLDTLGDAVTPSGERVVGELRKLIGGGYLRPGFPFSPARPVRNERGKVVHPVFIRANTIVEATGAVLTRRREIAMDAARALGYDTESLSLFALRVWTVVFFGGPGDARGILNDFHRAGHGSLDDIVGDRAFQRFDFIKRALISAAEAELLDSILLTAAEQVFNARRGTGSLV